MRDNQPKHRQLNRERGKLARQKASRKGLPAILIVCEGRETEPNYIQGLCEAKRINLANVQVHAGNSDTDVTALVKRARNLFAKDKDFDRVFVVFDDDGQPLEAAKKLAAQKLRTASGDAITVELIVSRPCFEFWLLLHFEYTTRPFATAAEVVTVLRDHLTDYDKANRNIFGQVAPGLERATARAAQLKRELEAGGAESPDTDMASLVEKLLEISRAS